MKRTLLFAIGGLLLGGVIHIAIVLALPYYAVDDAWTRIEKLGPAERFIPLQTADASKEAPIANLDPHMMQAVCRFDLDDGPVRVTASMPDEFWSVAVFDRRGRNVYSLNDRAAERQKLDLAILTSVQVAQIRQNPPASLETAIVLELPVSEGFVLLRAFIPDRSYEPAVVIALESADCAGPL